MGDIMKLANNFLERCLSYNADYERIKKEFQKEDTLCVGSRKYFYPGDIHSILIRDLFVLEEKDILKAISLCKAFKRSVEKRDYEFKLRCFKQETPPPYSSKDPIRFFVNLKGNLMGSRSRDNIEKQMLVISSIKECFPEYSEIMGGIHLLNTCKERKEVQHDFNQAKEKLESVQKKFAQIQDGHDAKKSVVEICSDLGWGDCS